MLRHQPTGSTKSETCRGLVPTILLLDGRSSAIRHHTGRGSPCANKISGTHLAHLSFDPIRHVKLWSVVKDELTRMRQKEEQRKKPGSQLHVDKFIAAIKARLNSPESGGDARRRVPEVTVSIDW